MNREHTGKLTRRTFLGGTLASAAALATAGLASCAPQQTAAPSESGTAAKATDSSVWTWPEKPEPITEFADTVEADVVVVGAGIAGLATACSCAENGLSVIVIEKNSTFSARGAQYGSMNSNAFKELGVFHDVDEIAANWIAQCNSRCNERLVYEFLNRSGEAIDWLSDKVINFGGSLFPCGFGYLGTYYPEYKGTLIFYPPEDNKDETLTYNNMPHNMLLNDATKAGAQFIFDTKAEQLVQDENGRVTAVIASAANEYRKYVGTKAVVLATGDISGNEEMCRVLSPLMYRCTSTQYVPLNANMGEGHIMAKHVGAKMEDGPFSPMIHPQAYSRLQGPNILLNVNGERFMNEDTWAQGRSVEILNQPGNVDYAWCIWSGDTEDWIEWMISTLPYGGGMFWDSNRVRYNPETGISEANPQWYRDMLNKYLDEGSFAWQVKSLAEAAEKMEVDEAVLRQTLTHYNEMCDLGIDSDFHKRAELLHKVDPDASQFTVYKVGPARMVAPGGMLIDTRSQVLDEDSNPIDGLYAVGNCSGGLYAVDYPLVINGNSHGRAITFGYLIGRQLAGLE